VLGPSWAWSCGSWIYNYLCTQCLSPLMLWVRISISARCTPLCDKVCQCLATGRWFSPGTSVSSTNQTDRHDITDILLIGSLNTITQTKTTYLCSLYPKTYFLTFELQIFTFEWIIKIVVLLFFSGKQISLIFSITIATKSCIT
jgi:hypothetical protein